MRRLPVYLLIETSGSMRGESIHSVNVGVQAMLSALRQDPYALESVHISIITYDNEAREYVPLTALADFQFSDIEVPSAGGTFTGAGSCPKRYKIRGGIPQIFYFIRADQNIRIIFCLALKKFLFF